MGGLRRGFGLKAKGDSANVSGDENTDGGKHDVSRDGPTGKTADDINPKDYEQGYDK